MVKRATRLPASGQLRSGSPGERPSRRSIWGTDPIATTGRERPRPPPYPLEARGGRVTQGALAPRATLGWIVQRLRRTELAFATQRRPKLGTTGLAAFLSVRPASTNPPAFSL